MNVRWMNGIAMIFFGQGSANCSKLAESGPLPVIVNKGCLGTQPLLLIYISSMTLFMIEFSSCNKADKVYKP